MKNSDRCFRLGRVDFDYHYLILQSSATHIGTIVQCQKLIQGRAQKTFNERVQKACKAIKKENPKLL